MAGAGKTTFVQRINAYLHSLAPPSPPYLVNLDPAVTRLPYEANIDIRDTVNYQEVMKQTERRYINRSQLVYNEIRSSHEFDGKESGYR